MHRISSIVLFATLSAATAAVAAAAQRDQRDRAIRRCEDELQFSMNRDVGGPSPDAVVDDRRVDVRELSRNEYEVSGQGMYTRDNNDRGRRFTFRCTVDMASGRVNARYDWSRGDSGSGSDADRPGATRPGAGYDRPGFGSGAGPRGEVWFSGGILSRSSGKALDVQDRSMRDGGVIQQWEYAGAANQQWDIVDVGRGEYVIVSRGSNKVLDVSGGSGADGAPIVQHRWQNNANQRWRFERVDNQDRDRERDAVFQIINVGTGKCLDVKDQAMQNGVSIQQWSCAGAANQMWRLRQ